MILKARQFLEKRKFSITIPPTLITRASECRSGFKVYAEGPGVKREGKLKKAIALRFRVRFFYLVRFHYRKATMVEKKNAKELNR